MTVNELVEQAFNHYRGSAVTLKELKNYFSSIRLKINDEIAAQIFGYYNRKILDSHYEVGEKEFQEDYGDYASARKDLDAFIKTISKNMSPNEFLELKQRINTVVDAAVLWSKKNDLVVTS